MVELMGMWETNHDVPGGGGFTRGAALSLFTFLLSPHVQLRGDSELQRIVRNSRRSLKRFRLEV